MEKNKKRKLLKNIFFFLALFFLFFSSIRIYYHLTDDFRLGNIHHPFLTNRPLKEEYFSRSELEKIKKILSQFFSYIGKGAQSYAFVSQDDQYILKFFKVKHLRKSPLLSILPPIPPFNSYIAQSIERKEREFLNLLKGYETAFDLNANGSGLVYLHFFPTGSILEKVQLIDKLGFIHQVNLNETAFLIQEKGEIFRDRLEALLSTHQIDKAKQAIQSIFDMYLEEYKKGLYDRDHGVMQNTGFLKERPFHLDVGKISYNPKILEEIHWKNDLEFVLWKIHRWCNHNFKKESPILKEFMAELFFQKTGNIFIPENLTISMLNERRI